MVAGLFEAEHDRVAHFAHEKPVASVIGPFGVAASPLYHYLHTRYLNGHVSFPCRRYYQLNVNDNLRVNTSNNNNFEEGNTTTNDLSRPPITLLNDSAGKP